MPNRPVFHDASGRRARNLSRLAWIAAVVTTVIAAAFIATLLTGQTLSPLPLVSDKHLHALPLYRAGTSALLKSANDLARKLRAHQHAVPRSTYPGALKTPNTSNTPKLMSPSADKPLAMGFYVNWDDNSYPSLKRMLPQLDWVVPSWINSSGADMALHFELDPRVLDLIQRTKPGTAVLPMWQNANAGEWDSEGLARLLANPQLRAERLRQVEQFLSDHHLQGLVIDFESVPKSAHKNLLSYLAEIKQSFAAHQWTLAIAVPFDDPEWNYDAYADVTDYLMLMAYDEHWETGRSGSIAGEDWFETTLKKRMAGLDPKQVIVCIGGYGYDWTKGKPADDITFQEAMLTAHESESEIDFDSNALNPHYSYEDDNNVEHQVWFLDAVTAFNEIRIADDYRPAGYALWRLGSEDPSIQSIFGKPYGTVKPEALKNIAMGADIDMEGTGEILRITSRPNPGEREFTLDDDGDLIVDQTYKQLPSSYVIQRVGAVPHKVALTFDDGPDPVWTPQILDILKQKKVHASFFIIGENGQTNPDLLQRLYDEGHDIGNHTFTHPNLGESPAELTEIELNATQRLVEAVTGHSMRFFRPPYFGDAEPTTADELIPVERAQAMGYVTVGLRVDPDDWKHPPAATIVQRVLEQIADPNIETRGQIVLLHDAGGDRSQTVAALPLLIDALRARGYELVPVSMLAGLTHAQAMPAVAKEPLSQTADRIVFFVVGWMNHVLTTLFILAIGLGLLRLFVLCGLGSWHRLTHRKKLMPAATDGSECVSVLIPAFNESKVIASAVQRILSSDHSNIEIIVIDDGSTDDTSKIVREQFGGDARVQLLTLENGGKARAINSGLKFAHGEVIVVLDADTQFENDTINKLVRWFVDPSVGAVAGNAKVGNRINTITRWQALEYITAQNLERRALAAINSITVVPGAVGAWRRTALDQVGGFPVQTLAEDQDLTLEVQRVGFRVVYDETAIAWTEAPEKIAGLAKQRFRWSFGTLQCLWKHRDMLLRRRYGMLGCIALPQVWLFQILFGLISPLVDLAMIWQLISTGLDFLQHKQQADTTNLAITGFYYAVFTLVDVGAAVIAFMLEGKEDRRLLWWLIQQRFGYRQIMYYVVVKSVIVALRGSHVGWGKLDRTASVIKNN